jgi:hypothetical protein
MQNASQSKYVSQHSQRLVVFPGKTAAPRLNAKDSHTRFERLLIFVLCTLWAIGMVGWTLFSLVGIGHGAALPSVAIKALSAPSSMPTVQSAAMFAVRVMIGL